MIDIDWYITLLSHKIHTTYVDKNFRLLSVYVLYRYTSIVYMKIVIIIVYIKIWKTAPYHTHAVLYSMTHNDHVQW